MFELNPTHRPRLSRETRRLLAATALAVLTLWVLARVRFPDQPAPQNPVTPLLSQLSRNPGFANLASEVAQARNTIEPLLLALHAPGERRTGAAPSGFALRVRDDLAVALSAEATPQGVPADASIISIDPASRLMLVRTQPTPRVTPQPWTPQQLDSPHFLMATQVAGTRVSVRPVLLESLQPMNSPAWVAPVWAMPPQPGVTPGSFLFTSDGQLAGLVVDEAGRPAIVPGETLFLQIDRLLAHPYTGGGDTGFEVQALTPSLAAATGATAGVLVSWVAPRGPAASLLQVADVIETADGQPLTSDRDWSVRRARMAPGQVVKLRVRRGPDVREIALTATWPAEEDAPPLPSELALQRVARVGSRVTAVPPGSSADVAGLQAGDVITHIAGVQAPTPAQIRAVFAETRGSAVVIGITRGTSHIVMSLIP